jgi:hypothetical protein
MGKRLHTSISRTSLEGERRPACSRVRRREIQRLYEAENYPLRKSE